MKKIISICGNICNDFAAFKATLEDDDLKRKETAESWSKRYESDIKPEDINCEGCLSKGKIVFSYCNVCEIRKCGFEKGVENCAHCDEYICDKLEGFFKSVPDNRKVLDNIRNTIE
jgi:hypothetical protein